MKLIKEILKTLAVSLALISSTFPLSYAVDAGNRAAIDSASPQGRNIVGIEISTATIPQRMGVGCNEEGVFVSAVIPKHPAAIAGLKVGDVITKINENPVKDHSEALEVMDGLDAGQSYLFEVYRVENGKPQILTINVLIEKVPEKAIGKIS